MLTSMDAKVKKVLVLRLELPGMDHTSASRMGGGNPGGAEEQWQLKHEREYNPAREWWTLHVEQANAEATADELAAAAKAIREAMEC